MAAAIRRKPVFPTPTMTWILLAAATLFLEVVLVTGAANCGCSPDILSSKSGYCSSGQTSEVLVVICQQGVCDDDAAAAAPSCDCPPDLCCSRFGYCGSASAYCGTGCQQGPCYAPPPSPKSSNGASAPPPSPTSSNSSGTVVAEIVTPQFFDSIIDQADTACPGKKFYSRDAFLDSTNVFPRFGTQNNSKQEIAAFFAHVTNLTDHFCYIDEVDGSTRDYCDESNTRYPCAPGKEYYGRGPLQLAWNFNYGAAGSSIGVDILNEPDTVATDPVISFKTALWFWMTNVHDGINSGKGFGATIRAINGGIECSGVDPATVTVTTMVQYYKSYCR